MKLLISLFLFALMSSALAAGRPYGYAGCGFGSVLVGKDGPQIIGATTNKISTQTFSISSGTSNCVTMEDQTARIKNFIEANYESLVVDMSKGNGDTLVTLSHLYGCEQKSFKQALQKNYNSITETQNDAQEMMRQIHQVMQKDNLSHSCYYAI